MKTKVYLPKNSMRMEMVEKAKQVFDFVMDAGSSNVTLSSIIDQLSKYESEWERHPSDASAMAVIPTDKLSMFFKEISAIQIQGAH